MMGAATEKVDQACNCWVFCISNKCNGLIFNMEYAI